MFDPIWIFGFGSRLHFPAAQLPKAEPPLPALPTAAQWDEVFSGVPTRSPYKLYEEQMTELVRFARCQFYSMVVSEDPPS